MASTSKVLSLLIAVSTLLSTATIAQAQSTLPRTESTFKIAVQKSVFINDLPLKLPQIQWLEKKYKIKVQAGAYWYDARSGLWGINNGPALGVILPHLKLGGPLKAHASGGGTGFFTGVFVNGRELHPYDVSQLRAIYGYVKPGYFWLDAKGNVGYVGGKAFANLLSAAKRSNGNNFYRNSYTGIGSGSSGNSGYVMGKDWSVSW